MSLWGHRSGFLRPWPLAVLPKFAGGLRDNVGSTESAY